MVDDRPWIIIDGRGLFILMGLGMESLFHVIPGWVVRLFGVVAKLGFQLGTRGGSVRVSGQKMIDRQPMSGSTVGTVGPLS